MFRLVRSSFELFILMQKGASSLCFDERFVVFIVSNRMVTLSFIFCLRASFRPDCLVMTVSGPISNLYIGQVNAI